MPTTTYFVDIVASAITGDLDGGCALDLAIASAQRGT
jgi:hypothetical protein